MNHIHSLLKEGRYSEAAKEINELLYASGDPRLYQLWAFIRAVEFNESVGTVKVNLRLGTIIFAPSFVIKYMQSLDDLLFIIIHERSHLVLGLEYPGRVPQLLRGRHLSLGSNAIFKFIEDVWCNTLAYRMFPSHINTRFYADKDVAYKLLCPEELDEDIFGSRLVIEHRIAYSKPRSPGYLFSLVWEWFMERLSHKSGQTHDRMAESDEDGENVGQSNPDQPDNAKDMKGKGEKHDDDTFFGDQSGHDNEKSEDLTDASAKRVGEHQNDTREAGHDDDDSDVRRTQSDPLNIEDYEGIVVSETLTSSDYVKTNPEQYYTNPEPENRHGITYMVEKTPPNRWNDWDFQILRATRLLAEAEEAARLNTEERKSHKTNTNIKIMSASIARLMIQQNTENTVTGIDFSMPHHLSRQDAFSLAMGVTPLFWRVLYNAGKDKPDFHVYFDVSGSMAQYYIMLPRLLSQLRPYISKMYQFSDTVTEIKEQDFKKIFTTRGTNFQSVVDAVHKNKSKDIIMFSDGHSLLKEERPDFVKKFIYLATYRPFRATSDAWRKWADHIIQLE